MKNFFGSMVIFLVAFATVVFTPACGEIGDPLYYSDPDGDNPAMCSPELCRNGRICVLSSGVPVCIDGVVQRECTADEECADHPKRICGDDGVCKDNPKYCDELKECLSPYECQGNTCRWVGECAVDSDCPSGHFCDNNTRTCVSDEGQCTVDSDCPSGQECRSKVCIGSPSGDDDDDAIPECTMDSDCLGGRICADGTCVLGGSTQCDSYASYEVRWSPPVAITLVDGQAVQLYSFGGAVIDMTSSQGGSVWTGRVLCSSFNRYRFNVRLRMGSTDTDWAARLDGSGVPYVNGAITLNGTSAEGLATTLKPVPYKTVKADDTAAADFRLP